MAKAKAASSENVGSTVTIGRPGTMAITMSEEEYNALPEELREQIARSPAPKDSIGYYFDKMLNELKDKEDPKDRQFNVKDVLVWCYRQSNQKVFKTQSVRTVLKKRLAEGQIVEVEDSPGRDKVYTLA